MKAWYSHVILGLLIAIAFVIVMRGYTETELAASMIAIIVGSVLPDVDHPAGKLRKGLRSVILLSIIVLLYFFLTNWAGVVIFSVDLVASLIMFAVVLFLGYLISKYIDKMIPPHRGIVHSIIAVLVYVVLCGIAAGAMGVKPFVVGVAGGIGYLAHVISDMI